jgi:hypothetical protein
MSFTHTRGWLKMSHIFLSGAIFFAGTVVLPRLLQVPYLQLRHSHLQRGGGNGFIEHGRK